jgi:phosphohistidine swiveling domain-containing protein
MMIDFQSIGNKGPYKVYDVAPGKRQENNGSFIICSIANADFNPQSTITGETNGAAIALTADGKPLPHRLQIGKKSINQLRLWQFGCHIPHTVVLDFSLCDHFKWNGDVDLGDIYEQVIKPKLGASVAVRCSSNLEDGDAQSFAGTFDTYLDVPNQLDEIRGKIFQSYRKFCASGDGREDAPQYHVRLGIMIQQMIQPKYSGFLFTLDPVNPPSDWLKIEYWQGPRGGSEGFSTTLNRETGKRVRSGRVSSRAPLPMIVHRKLHSAAIELERHFGTPQDIEFLISGEKDTLYLVQSRPVTAFSYSPDKVRVDQQQRLSAILEENRRLYRQDPVLSSTNIVELFTRAIPLGYSIFKYGFAGTPTLEGGISIGRSRLGYARLDPEDGANLFYTVADQARTNLIVDALTFRLPGISKDDYLAVFVKHYLEQVAVDPVVANYPEDGLYLQTEDPERWLEIAEEQGECMAAEFSEFLRQIIHVHAPREYGDSVKFFRENEDCYRDWLNRNLSIISPEGLRGEINNILSYLQTQFCPQYVIYARLAFLCTHVAKQRLEELLELKSGIEHEQLLNELLRGVRLPAELEEPSYPEFERLYKQGRVPLVEFLYRFQHLGSLDISQPRLGEYPPEKLTTVFGQSEPYGFDSEPFDIEDAKYAHFDNAKFGFDKDPEFQLLYTYGGRFMLLREKAKSDLLKLLWALKRMLIEFARRNHVGELVYYLELDEALALEPEKHDAVRMLAMQRKAYLEACRWHKVRDVLLDLQSSPFEKRQTYDDPDGERLYRFIRGKVIFHGRAEGICLTASSNEEFIDKLASYREKNIENIVGVFKGIELSYFNVSALVGFTTESGGYLSHAATIAREFRLPYITGISFDQFRDGDYLILDTENEQVLIRR